MARVREILKTELKLEKIGEKNPVGKESGEMTQKGGPIGPDLPGTALIEAG